MKNSSESSKNLKIVMAGVQPAETLEKGIITNDERAGKKVLPEKGRTILEGEIAITLGDFIADKEGNKHINVKFWDRAKEKQVVEQPVR